MTVGPGSTREPARAARRRVAARVTTAAACLLVLVALVAPSQIGELTPGAFFRVPVEALLGVAALLVLPARARPVTVTLAGAALGLLAVLKIVDMGFLAVLARPFDPVNDWMLFGRAGQVLGSSIGSVGAVGSAAAAMVLAVALLVGITLAVRRLSRLAVGHPLVARRWAGALGVVWVTCAVLGAQLVPGVPVASADAASLVHDRALQVRAGVADQRAFAAQTTVDPFGDVPAEELLAALRGKDVVVAFVESYGRDAVENPAFAPRIGGLLDAGDRRLEAAGFASRSAFLTAPIAGGGSWLAHATFLSGLWIDDEQRYRTLLASDRLTLTGAFGSAGWRTVGVMPGNTYAWPEGEFYGYQQVYDSRDLGYRGPRFGWATMPDQYVLSAFDRIEYSVPDRDPLMAEIALVSSHGPWRPIPRLIDWADVGDGSVYDTMVVEGDSAAGPADPSRLRTDYRRSIEYSLNSLISWMETHGDDDLVLVVLGDHQPAPIITGAGAGTDVPISIVTRDRAVLERIFGWGWQDGLRPGPQAPVWPMDAFRDRFLDAFGS